MVNLVVDAFEFPRVSIDASLADVLLNELSVPFDFGIEGLCVATGRLDVEMYIKAGQISVRPHFKRDATRRSPPRS